MTAPTFGGKVRHDVTPDETQPGVYRDRRGRTLVDDATGAEWEARRRVEAAATRKQHPAARANGSAPTSPVTQRLADARVDLLAHIDGSLPERAWLPCSQNMLARGARHHVAAPLKSGKSLAFLVHAVDMTIAGASVVILDRENGADEYARRLRDVLGDRAGTARDAIRERLAYYAWPALKLTDGAELANALHGVDVVILDSTRTFLSALALDEDRSNDFATFATAIIEPLFRVGVATLQLDNTGHGDSSRARGSSSKGDLADVLYSLKTTAGFDEGREGRIKLKRERSRFGDVGPAFTMTLGAGKFGSFHGDDEQHAGDSDTFRPTALMERVSRFLEQQADGVSKNRIEAEVRGNRQYVRDALAILVDEGYVEPRQESRSIVQRSVRPYREATENNPPPPTSPIRPDLAPTSPEANRSSTSPIRPTPKGAKGAGEPPAATELTDLAQSQDAAA